MAAGTVTIAEDGTVSGTGASRRLFDILEASMEAALTAADIDIPTGEDAVSSLQSLADMANDFGSWLYTELTSHTLASVGTSLSGLQRMPAVTTENTDCKAPGTTKTIPLTHP
jgi:hypothetical protein